MLYNDAFKTARRALTHSKTRTSLTMLGIIIGIASVIILMSIGKSAQNLILNQVESIGSNLVIIIPGAPTNGKFASPASSRGIVITSLKQQDVDSLRREPSIVSVVPIVNGQGNVVYGSNNSNESYQGVTADYFALRNLTVGKGYQFTKSDVDASNHVVVMGPDLADTLFGKYVNPINKIIRINNISLRVVGVLAKGGVGAFGVDQGNILILPISVVQKELLGITYFNGIAAEASANYDTNFVVSRVKFDIRQNHGITDPNKDDFSVQTQADILALLGNITSILTIFLAAIASISLVVGGIGIMNIMLVAVTERTKEIGLRKAVGATDGDIMEQFLIESIMLTLVGGILGILVGGSIVSLIYLAITKFTTLAWTFAFPLSAVILGVGVSTFAGVVFGIYPARQAARKNPIDALRYE